MITYHSMPSAKIPEDNCSVCLEALRTKPESVLAHFNPGSTNPLHSAYKKCLQIWARESLKQKKDATCPTCRKNFNSFSLLWKDHAVREIKAIIPDALIAAGTVGMVLTGENIIKAEVLKATVTSMDQSALMHVFNQTLIAVTAGVASGSVAGPLVSHASTLAVACGILLVKRLHSDPSERVINQLVQGINLVKTIATVGGVLGGGILATKFMEKISGVSAEALGGLVILGFASSHPFISCFFRTNPARVKPLLTMLPTVLISNFGVAMHIFNQLTNRGNITNMMCGALVASVSGLIARRF